MRLPGAGQRQGQALRLHKTNMKANEASDKLAQLFMQHGAASLDKQIYLEAMLGKARWSFALDEGVLAFRLPHQEPLQLNVQLLGTESADDHSWMWAWNNTTSAIHLRLLKAAQDLRAFGEREDVPELCTPLLTLSSTINGGRIAAVACGVARAACFFRVAYPGGVLFMLIKDARYKRSVLHPLKRIAQVFPRFVAQHAVVDQRFAFISYLKFYRLKVEEHPRQARLPRPPHRHRSSSHAHRAVPFRYPSPRRPPRRRQARQ